MSYPNPEKKFGIGIRSSGLAVLGLASKFVSEKRVFSAGFLRKTIFFAKFSMPKNSFFAVLCRDGQGGANRMGGVQVSVVAGF